MISQVSATHPGPQLIPKESFYHTGIILPTFFFTCIMIVNIVTNDVILNINVTGGTGRFEGATGPMTLTGIHTESGIPISGEGYMSFPK